MAGTYVEGQSKVLSGVYTLIKAIVTGISMGARGTVAYPFTANWGPVNTLTDIITQPEFKMAFGTGHTAAKIGTLAFKGKPQRVLAYRMATASAAKGTASVPATTGTALELETLYPSDRPFTVGVKDRLAGGKIIEITEGGVLLFKAEGTTIQALAAQLNTSDYVRTTTIGTEMPVNTAGITFTGGSNGETVTATEYEAFLMEVEGDGRPNAFSLDGIHTAAIVTLAKEWTRRVREEGLYITFVHGGPAAWDTAPADANTESKAFNYRGIVNVGNGVDGYAAADMAIFIAARVASVPLNRTLTDEIVDFREVNKKLTPGQRVTAKESGTMVFVKDGDTIMIDEGVNTLTTPGADEVKEMGKIRVNNTLDQIARDLEAFGNEYKRNRSNTQEARETYAATIENSYFTSLEAMEVLQPGAFYRPDPEYHGKDAVHHPKIDEAFFYADITPVDSMERIYQKISVTF